MAEATHPFVYWAKRQKHPVLFHHRTPVFPKKNSLGDHFWKVHFMEIIEKTTPHAPCMQYLPTFTINLGEMWVNIPYMGMEMIEKSRETKKSDFDRLVQPWALDLEYVNMSYPMTDPGSTAYMNGCLTYIFVGTYVGKLNIPYMDPIWVVVSTIFIFTPIWGR